MKDKEIKKENTSNINKNTPIEKILSTDNEILSKIMGRYGLYCSMRRRRSWKETLGEAMETHGLSNEQKEKLVIELNQIIEVKL